VRVIEYTVTTTDERGAARSELFCVATTLIDPHAWPIEKIPARLSAAEPDHHGGSARKRTRYVRCGRRSRPGRSSRRRADRAGYGRSRVSERACLRQRRPEAVKVGETRAGYAATPHVLPTPSGKQRRHWTGNTSGCADDCRLLADGLRRKQVGGGFVPGGEGAEENPRQLRKKSCAKCGTHDTLRE
jgi:hypothetical protein